MVTVYSKDNCVQCTFTKRYLDSNGIGYTLHMIDEDEQALAVAQGFGYLQAPVVVLDFETAEKVGVPHWSGARPDLLAKLK